jgi:lysozyme
MARPVPEQALTLIKTSEGLKLDAYPDPATGAEPWTIGYGHTGRDVHPGMTITQDQADALLDGDVAKVVAALERLVKPDVLTDLTDGQYAALIDFTFNLGAAALAGSTLLVDVNARKFDQVPGQIKLWTHANHKVMPGLVARRAAEAALWEA